MELIMYKTAYIIGGFIPMITFMIVAILTAKRKISWVFYAAGGIFQFLSLSGELVDIRRHSYIPNIDMYKAANLRDWIISAVLMIVFAILIKRRALKLEIKARQEYEAAHPIDAEINLPNSWQCDCGRKNAGYTLTCPCGIKKIEIKSRMSNNQNTPTQNQ